MNPCFVPKVAWYLSMHAASFQPATHSCTSFRYIGMCKHSPRIAHSSYTLNSRSLQGNAHHVFQAQDWTLDALSLCSRSRLNCDYSYLLNFHHRFVHCVANIVHECRLARNLSE